MVEDSDLPVDRLDVSVFRVPPADSAGSPDSPEETTVIVVEGEAGGVNGLGYVYADVEIAELIHSVLKPVVLRKNAIEVVTAWSSISSAIQNQASPSARSIAIAAVDICLWDLKARLLRMPLISLFGATRLEIPAYGASASHHSWPQLEAYLQRWIAEGLTAAKIVVGASPDDDLALVQQAAQLAAHKIQLFVDAQGAYSREQALQQTRALHDLGVVWFEDPVSPGDLEALREIRNQKPAGMNIAAGKESFDSTQFRKIVESHAVDVLKADATRCAGITGFLQADSLSQGFGTALSSSAAPSLHGHLGCVAMSASNVEYLYEHVQIEQLLFDGALRAEQGRLRPDLTRPGLGLELRPEAEQYRA